MLHINSVQPWRLSLVTLQSRSSLADSLWKTWEKSCFFILPTVEGNFHHCWSTECVSAFKCHWARQHLNGTHAPGRSTCNPRHKERSVLLPDSQSPGKTDFMREQGCKHRQHNSCKAVQPQWWQTRGSSAKPAPGAGGWGGWVVHVQLQAPQTAAQSSTLCRLTASW